MPAGGRSNDSDKLYPDGHDDLYNLFWYFESFEQRELQVVWR